MRPPGSEVVGSTLSLRRDPLRAELWSEALEDLAMAPADSDIPTAARRLEVFLDRLGAGAAEPVGYLLDPAYSGMLTREECELAERLRTVATAGDESDEAESRPIETPAGRQVARLLETLGLRR